MTEYVGAAIAVLVGAVVLTGGVRKNAFRALNAYKRTRIWYLRVTGGRTESSEAERRVVSGQAWEEWCDSIKSAGAALVYQGSPMDGFNQAEGYRYLSRLVRVSFEAFMECSDPTAPKLVSLVDGIRDCPVKLGADNPDNLYQNATLDSRETYILKGKRNTVNYLGFGTQAGQYGQAGGLSTVMSIDFSDLKHVKPNGEFEIQVSSRKPERDDVDWLELNGPEKGGPPKGVLIVRQTFLDRKTEVAAEFDFKRVSGPHVPSPFSCERLEEALQTSALFVCGASMMFSRWAHGFQQHVNTLPLFDQETSNRVGGDHQIRYYHSYWALPKQEQVLVIESDVPGCEHWNFQLNNHWMESLDYRYYQVHVNKKSAKYVDGEGASKVKVIVAHRNPAEVCSAEQLKRLGAYNWIDTCYHHQGQMLWRWVKPKCADSELPQPQCRVTTLDAL